MTPLNEQQERFCRAIVEGKSQRDAYLAAGYKPANENATDGSASRLLRSAKVQSRIAELRKPVTKRMEVTLESVTEMLKEDRELARKNNQTGAAVAAAMGIAKLHGLDITHIELTDKTVYTVGNRPQTDEAWETEFSPDQRPN